MRRSKFDASLLYFVYSQIIHVARLRPTERQKLVLRGYLFQ
jgi:hypothetical protein